MFFCVVYNIPCRTSFSVMVYLVISKICYLRDKQKQRIVVVLKVRKTVKIRDQYNQFPHLTKDTPWKSDKITITLQKQEPRGQPTDFFVDLLFVNLC